MALLEGLGLTLPLRYALLVGLAVSLAAALVLTPWTIRKLRGAGITGRDRNKPNQPEVPEMGGLAVFLAFNAGVFAVLGLSRVPSTQQMPVLACLVVAAGACITGVLDDLMALRQRFKAFIPFVFAAPLALYVADWRVAVPLVGALDLGLLYPFVAVPLAVACASNSFNMLEGFNGLGAGLGIIIAGAIAALAILSGNLAGLLLLFPLMGALGGFLWFNAYPAKVFPGDTMTLLIGAVLAAAAILSKVEFWAALLFFPHVVEFFLKARGSFEAESFAQRAVANPPGPPRLVYEGPTQSLTHILLKRGRATEPGVTASFWAMQLALAIVVVGAFVILR